MPGEAADPAPQIGATIDEKFVVDRVLGQGGMGVVVAAHPVDGGAQVALKLLLPEANVIPNAVERFFREARALARLTSEHVVRVFDIGRQPDTGLPYMVMELLTGKDLDELVKERGPLPVEDACECIVQACSALSEAHGLGIIHRDIKPANLFWAEHGGGHVTKVIDFGIAKEVDSSSAQTQAHVVMGSVAHMSPEQLRAAKHADVRSDIWSIGATLFELLTGKRPFGAKSLPQLIVAVNVDPPRSVSSLRPEIPEGLEAIVLRCLEKKPDRRFQSMQELAAALAPFAANPAQASAAKPARTSPHTTGQAAPTPAPGPEGAGAPTQGRGGRLALGGLLALVLLGLLVAGLLVARGQVP
jgi:eukaryotic-like serine/threonine-protein kinase